MCDYIECVFIKIHYRDYNLIVGVVYRPPNSNMVDFNDSLHDILEEIAHHPFYIICDFNLDLLKHELHRPTEWYLDTMYANSYIPMINRPTRITRNICTLIDNIFTNYYSIDSQLFNGILKADISDYYILFHIIKSTDSTRDVNSDYKTVRIVNESRINGFVEKNSKYWLVCTELAQRLPDIFWKMLCTVQNNLWWIISTDQSSNVI